MSRSLEPSGGTTVEFRILGPFEVLRDGELVDIGPHKQQSLLVLLLLHANHVVPTDRILEDLWGDDAGGKENALWVYISRLRGALESAGGNPEMLVTRDHGYVLNVDPDAIDAGRFERAVSRGRSLLPGDPAAASTTLRDALEEWRGPPLQEFAYDDFTHGEIAHLENLRTGAMEDALEADLRCGKAGELVSELERLHEANPLSERPTSLLMLALYRAGRSADALRTFERFRRTLGEDLGIDPSPELRRLEEQILLHDTRLQVRRPRQPAAVVWGTTNPFRGLRAFSEEDASVFFGRDRVVAETVRRLADDHRLIVLVGPSGSGKSSIVRAGLMPAVRKGAIPGSDRWSIASMVPGSDPFIELEAALLRSTIDPPDSLSEPLRAEDGSGLMRAALRVLPTDSSRLLLIIDQFEELFTLVDDDAVRQRFLDQIVSAVDDPHGRVVVVLTLRADFYRRALDHAAFATRMGAGVVNVASLAPDELEAAALEPALRSGVTLEPALLADLVADVIGQPGALPMFQYTLTELFDRSVGGVLTAGVYREMGGVRGSLTRSADALLETFNEEQQMVAKQVLLRLVAITEHDEWSRRRVPASELVSLGIDIVAIEEVIERFARQRLLSLDRNPVTGAPTVEVAHEALLHEWKRLRKWIEQNREDLVCRRALAAAANVWNDAGRDQDYLYAGGRLDEALAWAGTSAIKLTEREREFLAAGEERLVAERSAAEESKRRTERLQRNARWRTWGLVAAIVALVAVAGGVLFAVTRPEGPKIALVQDIDPTGGVQELMEQGWNDAARRVNFEGELVTPLLDPEEDIRDLADAGYDLIVDGLFDDGTLVYGLALEYPATTFVVFDDQDPGLENVAALHFVRDGGAYLMGMAAALESETGKIGFIGGRQRDTTETRRAAYTAGARSVTPDIEVESVYLGPFLDPNSPYLAYDLAKETAEDMYRSGIDVIHHSAGHVGGGAGISAAAAELRDELDRELWVIGSEVSEQRGVSPDQSERFLLSMWKRWDKAVEESIRAYVDGELEPGLHELGLASRSVDYSRDGAISEQSLAVLDRAREEIVTDSVEIESGNTAAPSWTREPAVTIAGVFDGTACAFDTDTAAVVAGDVVRIDLVNESAVPVGLLVGDSDDGIDIRDGQPLSTWIAPDSSGAVAIRLNSGVHVARCFTSNEMLEGVPITAVFETTCEGPTPESDDPIDVVHALGAAVNARDAAAVCSLFADDAAVPGPVMAEMLTPADDALGFEGSSTSGFEVAGDVVTWTLTSKIVGREEQTRVRAEVVDGKILWLEILERE